MRFLKSESGQGLVEYALIIVLLAIVCIVALNFLADGLAGSMYNNIVSNL